MSLPVKIRVIVNNDDFRRLDLVEMPQTLVEFTKKVQEVLDIDKDFRIQYMDPDFNNEFMNVTTVHDIKDRSTIKLVYTSTESHVEFSSSASPFSLPTNSDDAASFSDSDAMIILPPSSPTLRTKPWPRAFPIPSFTYNVEMQLQRGNEAYKQTGAKLQPSPGLKSAILEKLAEHIFEYTAYPKISQINDVAAALVKKFPCLKENSPTGYDAWMIRLKYKMANFRTKLRNLECPEVIVNALKNKTNEDCLPAKNVKKPKKAEVNYCPTHPLGETETSLEDLRLQLQNDVKHRNNAANVRQKMSTTFSYRRKEVVHNSPSVADFLERWPALFTAEEISAEFQRISTLPLEVTFFAALDKVTPQLISIFEKKGGICGQKMIKHLQVFKKTTSDINQKRSAVLRTLCVYFGEDDESLIRTFMDNEESRDLAVLPPYPMGIYAVLRDEDHNIFADIGLFVDGLTILNGIATEARACILMLGAIYALNLEYPKQLKFYYEFVQKVLMRLESGKLSPKVLNLANKLN